MTDYAGALLTPPEVSRMRRDPVRDRRVAVGVVETSVAGRNEPPEPQLDGLCPEVERGSHQVSGVPGR